MPRVFRRLALFVVLVALIGCNTSSSGPATPSPVPVTLTSLTIGGSGSGTAGQTSQLTATAGFLDGTGQVVTVDGTESVTFGDPCAGRTLELSFSGSK
jgi:hypothetical protein